MQIYFYCSYAHSSRGFFMTRLDGTCLTPQDEAALPEAVEDFFSYARFRFLWRELEERTAPQMQVEPGECVAVQPQAEPALIRMGAFLGIREIHGTLQDGRSAVMNLAMLGDAEEITMIRRIALTLLSDYDAFEARMIGLMSVGGPCGYEIDGASFCSWLDACAGNSVLKRNADGQVPAGLLPHLTREPQTEPDLIRLAACCYDWERLRRYFGDGPEWQEKPAGMYSLSAFDRIFRGKKRPWTMSAETQEDIL